MCDNTLCSSNRILKVYGKCSDLCVVELDDHTHEGYVPGDCGIGGGDDIEFSVCLDCGKLQGNFPRKDPEFAKIENDDLNF